MPSETVTSLKECGLIVVVINAFFAMICDVIQVAILLVVIADSNFKFSNKKERTEALSHFYAEINLPCFNKVSIVTFCVYVPSYPPIPLAAAICLRCAMLESTPIALNDCVIELLPPYAG
jgi:hypothetical protein